MEYTRIVLLLFAISHLWNLETLRGVAVASQWGVACSFTCAPVFDHYVYMRMRRKHGWSVLFFYAGHLVLHVLPLCFSVAWLPRPTMNESTAAVALHGLWFSVVDLDRVYVPMRDEAWLYLFAVAVAAEIACAS